MLVNKIIIVIPEIAFDKFLSLKLITGETSKYELCRARLLKQRLVKQLSTHVGL